MIEAEEGDDEEEKTKNFLAKVARHLRPIIDPRLLWFDYSHRGNLQQMFSSNSDILPQYFQLLSFFYQCEFSHESLQIVPWGVRSVAPRGGAQWARKIKKV